MKNVAPYAALTLLLLVMLAALRTVLEQRLPFFRKWDESTRQAYLVLAAAAAALLAWSMLDLSRVQSFEIAGIKATLSDIKHRVDAVSDQLEVFYQRKKIEQFYAKNASRVRRVGTSKYGGPLLEVELEKTPIPGSIEVWEGVLQMPEQDYVLQGRTLRFPANIEKPDKDNGFTIKYYPRLQQGVSSQPKQPGPTTTP